MSKTRESALPLAQLDNATRKNLEYILGKEPAALADGERAFLFGRRDYLTKEQRKDYGVDGDVMPTAGAGNEDEGDEYDAMTAAQLKDELKARGLAVGGKVDELRDRLREDDEAEEAE